MENKTYYTENAGLTCPVKAARRDPVTEKWIEAQYVTFRRIGQDAFGSYSTSDPVEIEALDKRMVEVGDIFGPEEFNRRSVPADKRAGMLERELEKSNRLIAKLTADLEAKGAPKTAAK